MWVCVCIKCSRRCFDASIFEPSIDINEMWVNDLSIIWDNILMIEEKKTLKCWKSHKRYLYGITSACIYYLGIIVSIHIVHVHMYVCVCVYMYIYVCVCVFICSCIHTYVISMSEINKNNNNNNNHQLTRREREREKKQ